MTVPGPVNDRPSGPPAVLAGARWAAVAVGVALVIVSFAQARKPTAQLGDFGAYYRAGQYVVAGGTPYQLDPKYRELGAYMYCPAFAHVVCRPLAHLPYVWAMRVFLTINWLATAAVIALSLRLADAGRRRAVAAIEAPDVHPGLHPNRGEIAPDYPAAPATADRFWTGLIACAAVGTYLWADLHNGQVGTLLLLACLAWITLTLAGRPALGGACLSLAVGLKLYPLLLAPYLLLRRRWWPGLIGLAVGLLVQFVTPALFVGRAGLLPLHRQWFSFLRETQVPAQTYRAGNQSLLGVLARTPLVSDGVHLFSPERLHALERGYPALVLIVTAALYGWAIVRRVDPATAVAVLLVWMTIAAPRAWTFNFAAELPAAVLLSAALLRRRRYWPLALAALLGIVWAVAFDTNRLPTPTRWTAGTQFLYDKHFAAAVLLGVALVVVDLDRRGEARR